MRILIITISIFISVTILVSFYVNGQSGIQATSAQVNQEQIQNMDKSTTSIDVVYDNKNNIINNIDINNSLPENEDIISDPKPVKKEIAKDLKLESKSAIAMEGDDDTILFEQAGDVQAPIASITKLATALVFLDNNPGWDKIYEFRPADRVNGGKNNLYNGEKVAVKNLFYLSLVASDNSATKALVNSTGLPETEFIKRMNLKAQELGLKNTEFSDPIGLNCNNVSTAREIAKLAKIALDKKEIRDATLTRSYEFKTAEGKTRKVKNTDSLLAAFPQNGINILGGKTGFIDAAGYCFVGRFADSDGHEIISVVLGGKAINDRFEQTEEIVDWVYNNYQWE